MKKKTIYKGLRVEMELPEFPFWVNTNSEKERYLTKWIKDFYDFLRDHRSQDLIRLSIMKQYEDICSKCGREFELDDFEKYLGCKWCGEELERGLVANEEAK